MGSLEPKSRHHHAHHLNEAPVDICTLGMFIIDEIHFHPPKAPVFNILGGAGSYSALGARLLSPPPQSKSVGWIVDAGSDFPSDLRELIGSWQSSCLMRETPDRLTTRGWNGYGENEERAFRYTTPKLRLDENALSEKLLRSKSFHLICSPTRCMDLVAGIAKRRRHLPETTQLYVWEPVPDLCLPEQHDECQRALKQVHVVSPNHSELCEFFGKRGNKMSGMVNEAAIEECCDNWLGSGVGPEGKGSVVVRAGATGCYVASRMKSVWMPAYHEDSGKVLDPTGGGNAFLGGLAVRLARSTDPSDFAAVREAAAWASVAASFAIEQVGMPVLANSGPDETWNDAKVVERLAEYKRRLCS